MELESDAELYNKANKLIEEIYAFKKKFAKDLSLIETLEEYAYKKNIPIEEIGTALSYHKDFKVIFKNQLTKEKYFKSDNNIDDEYKEDEW